MVGQGGEVVIWEKARPKRANQKTSTLRRMSAVSLNYLQCVMWSCPRAQSIIPSIPMKVLCGKRFGQFSERAEFHLYIFELWLQQPRRSWSLEAETYENINPPEICRNLREGFGFHNPFFLPSQRQGGWCLNYKSIAHSSHKVGGGVGKERSREKQITQFY